MRVLKKISSVGISSLVLSLLFVSTSFAHVVVKPGEALTSTYTTFSVSVPNEREVPTTEIKLIIPAEIASVTPTVKQGWTITTEQAEAPEEDSHADTRVDSITWSAGSIPEGQRDDFTFSAKTPAEQGELVWKAYQVYADGTTIAWDKSQDDQPKKADGSPDFSTSGPFSVTQIVSSASADNNEQSVVQSADISATQKKANRALYVAIAATVVAFIALIIATKPKK